MISQFADIFVQMVVLFAVGATGYAAKRLNLMDEDFDKKFSKLILNTALPALILASVLTAETLPSATKILWTAGVSCASYVVLVAIGFSITAALVRLLVAPALVWLPLHFLVSDPVLLGVIVLLSAMPVATNGTMLCYQYGGDSKTMAQGTFVTTLGAVFTIPLLAVLFMA